MANNLQKGCAKHVAIFIIAVVLILSGAVYYFNQAEQKFEPVGVLNIETARAGDTFGAWTVRENNIKETEIKDFDGKAHIGLSGQITFSGSFRVTGYYVVNELHGGVIFYPDAQYISRFPRVIAEGKFAIALFNDFTDKGINDSGQATIVIDDLAYQEVFCFACDPWQGFYADVEEIISDTPEGSG